MKRRAFIKAGFIGPAAFAASGLTAAMSRNAQAAAVDVHLSAEEDFKTLIDGTSVFVWQFKDHWSSGPGALTSGLVVTEGDDVNITITNQLDRPINLVIPGVLSYSPAVSPGGGRTYRFTAPGPGSYYYTDDVNGEIGKAMGLSGPLVVLPASGDKVLYHGGPRFHRQYTLVLNELDDRLNSAIYNGQSYDMADYEPNYFFVNGMSYPDTTMDSETRIAMGLGEDIAIRFINTGCIISSQHFHGYHVRIASRNRIPETNLGEKDMVPVHMGECVDAILPVRQRGVFPMHTHYIPGVTANGTYGKGAIAIMNAT